MADLVGAGADFTASTSGAPKQEAPSTPVYKDADYHPILANWYTAKPYGFKFTAKDGKAMVMYLPISPSNLGITTPFATSVVPTLYGTVEEHSPVRYYDITIEGTTGMGPRYTQPFAAGGLPSTLGGRSCFTVQQTIASGALGGFASGTINKINSVISQAKDLFGLTPDAATGLQLDQTGYMAFHNLYRFLLKYKKDASGVDKSTTKRAVGSHPLIFFNYKDNNQHKVVVRTMSMRRDKEDPMSYHYSIVMRGYDLAPVDSGTSVDESRNILKELGLDGIDGSSVLESIKKKADQARGLLASVGSGVSSLGR